MEGLFFPTLNTILDYNLLADFNWTFVQLVDKTEQISKDCKSSIWIRIYLR